MRRHLLIAAGLIIIAGEGIGIGQAPTPVCPTPPAGETQPWLNSKYSPECRAKFVLNSLQTIDDKFKFVNGVTRVGQGDPEVLSKLGLQAWQWTDGPAGVNGGTGVTAFPTPITVAANFNPSTAMKYGEMLGEEVFDAGFGSVGGPAMDIPRTWHFGRTTESFGEDPFLLASNVSQEVRGIQSKHVIATLKHYAVYTQEQDRAGLHPMGSAGGVNEIVPERAIREIYLPGFRAAVMVGGGESVMCSFATINNVPACQNAYLFNILKKEWGFDGNILPDFPDAQRSIVPAFSAGLDWGVSEPRTGDTMGALPTFAGQKSLRQGVQDGDVPMSRIDDMIMRRLVPGFRIGTFDFPAKKKTEEISTPKHRAASVDVITGGSVLLKNSGNVLPINANVKTIAIIGAQATDKANVVEQGSPYVKPAHRIFRNIFEIPPDTAEHPSPEQTFSFPTVQARFFRILFTPIAPPSLAGFPKPVTPREVRLTWIAFHHSAKVDRFEAKAGFQSTLDPGAAPTVRTDPDSSIRGDQVVDLTSNLRADGTLDWTPPAGHWTVLRIGYSLTGQTNGPAEESSTGVEVDKLDPQLVRKYMEQYLRLYSGAGGKLGNSGVQNVLTDSWEAGVQNWTPSMLQQFRARRGYDPTPYLPTLAGWVVNDVETSNRFLWDFRRTLKEMLADNHYGTIEKVLHEHHMGYYTEAQGDTPRAIGDGMAMKSHSDISTGEYWYRPFATDPGQLPLKADLEESASVAHLYGKQLAAAESLTVAAISDPWSFSPRMLKPVADEIFAHGINRILLHESHHQPLIDAKPGFELAFFGQYFNRNDTWAEQAKPWVDYLARTSYMLQQGKYVADVAYFYGEDRNLTELFQHRFNTDVPAGYHYDYVNADALLSLLSVKNGKVVTPSGMTYRVLFVPSQVNHFTLPVLRRIRNLVRSGAVLVASKPEGGLGLKDDDQEIKAIADEVWGDARAEASSPHRFGAGLVYASDDLASALRAEQIAPDIAISPPESQASIMTLHRHTGDHEIYFLSNQQDRAQNVSVICRLRGFAPEIWHAEDGSAEPISYRSVQNGVSVQLHLEPYEALFLVFHESSMPSRKLPHITTTVLQTLSGTWQVAFEPGRGAPPATTFRELLPWNDSDDPGIKYFSGHATYTQTIHFSDSWLRNGHRLLLNLGEVRELAEVSVNGKAGRVVWHSPYTVDVTDEVKPGDNRLAITVTNLWPNRLIGDQQPGSIKYTFAPQSPYRAGSPLLRSGLLGPVQLLDKSLGH